MSKKIGLTFLLFTLSLITFVTSTYAWFSLAQSVHVNDIDMSIISDEYLFVSLDGVNYNSRIESSEIEKITKNVEFTDVTTRDCKTFTGSFYENRVPVANKDFISFTLWFKTNNPEVDSLFLADNVTKNYSYEEANTEKIDGTFAISKGRQSYTFTTFLFDETTYHYKDEIYSYRAQDALRIAVSEMNADSENLEEYDTRDDLSHIIFDPSEDESRGYGKLYGAYDLHRQLDPSFTMLPPADDFGTIYKLSEYTESPYETYDATSKCATFQKGYEGSTPWFYAKVQVKIWIEGWDADCLNTILRDSLIMQLKFRSAKLLTD